MSEVKVNKISPRSGTAFTLGDSGDTFTVPTGAGLTVTDEVKTNKISPATGTAFALGDSGDTFTVPSGATIVNSGTATGFAKTKQTVSTMVVSSTSGSTTIPLDDTIPQNTEGNEFMTLAITPTSATTKLQIDVRIQVTNGTADIHMITALFQDSTANALAAAALGINNSGNNQNSPMSLTYVMTSGTTSATTFKVRSGATSGTTYFNSRSGGRELGGVLTSSIVITEYET